MRDAVHRPRKGKESAVAVAYVHLQQFLSAAEELSDAWDPALDRGYPRYLPQAAERGLEMGPGFSE